MYLNLLLFAGLVYVPLAIGAGVRHHGLLRRDYSKEIMTITWLTLEPVAATISFWSIDLGKVADLAAAPVLGALWMLAMLLPAAFAAARLRLNEIQRGNFLLAAMFSNNGITLGAFVCLMFFGIEGQAMSLLFVLLFYPLLLSVGFGIGRHSLKQAALANGTSPEAVVPPTGLMRMVPYAAMTLGLVLNLTHVARPAFALHVNRSVVFLDVAIYSFAIGTLFTLGSVRRYLRECLVMSGLKFVISPLIGVLLFAAAAQVMHLSPLLLNAMIVQCAMPVAIMSVVVSRFCRLDMDLAAACWVFTTLAVAGIVPILALIVNHAR